MSFLIQITLFNKYLSICHMSRIVFHNISRNLTFICSLKMLSQSLKSVVVLSNSQKPSYVTGKFLSVSVRSEIRYTNLAPIQRFMAQVCKSSEQSQVTTVTLNTESFFPSNSVSNRLAEFQALVMSSALQPGNSGPHAWFGRHILKLFDTSLLSSI